MNARAPSPWTVPLALALAGLVPTSSAAQELKLEASVRPRTEGRAAGEVDLFFTSMRTQLGLRGALSRDARLFVQLQDARFWGGSSYGFDPVADAFDLYQGFFELGHRGESVLWTRVGRQEMDLANGRLIGYPEWSQFGRTFDGLRTTLRVAEGTVVDGFGLQLRESSAAEDAGDASLWGIWGVHTLEGGGSVQLFWIHDRDGDDPETGRSTFGGYHDGALGPLAVTLEGAWQTGTVRGRDLRDTYLLAGVLTLPLSRERGSVSLGYDRYSGAAAPAEGSTQAFSDLFGRNHRFLGFVDLFSDIPEDTEGRGLQDFRGRFRWLLPWDGEVGLAVHHFRVVDAGQRDSSRLADEVDLTLFWPDLTDGTFGVLAGISWAGLGEAGQSIGIAPGDVFFGYLMVQASAF